jgi:hypothetical protein
VGCGGIKFFSRYVIPEDSPIKDFEDRRYRGSTDKEYGFPIEALGNDNKGTALIFASLYQDKEGIKTWIVHEGTVFIFL